MSFWLAAGAFLAGFGLMLWTVTLFLRFGRGTPAPWDPPKDLVVRGPYRHVRNPMISGVLLTLLAEALFSQSWPLAAWMGVFFIANAVYLPCVEEKRLARRFGDAYVVYRDNVPRWIPRLTPWNPPH
jgi:protein-S-isoprenylcysteine O-methyltransferase Ste14